MPQTIQEEVEITALIRGILNGYPGNSAILREYLQNSDDAKASRQIFILDEKTYPSECIMDPALKDAQGPALIAYNDGVIRPEDWTALLKIHSSSKHADEDQTGKNGLGFRASYHLTENPHILSGQTLRVLDPHRVFKKHPGGMSIDTVDEGPAYKDQLSPFNSIIQGEIVPFFGTAFRLPFRTNSQAARSRISDKATHVAEFREILRNFVKNELESVILFLKHVTSIEVRRVDPLGRESVLGKVEIDRLDPTPHSGPVHRKITLSTEDGTSNIRTWFFHHHGMEKEEATKIMSSRLEYDIKDRLAVEKLAPGVDIAFPLEGPNVKGGLFTLLPLPINIPGSSFHMNATFALTPDRQNLKKKQEVGDVHSRERFLVEWNTIILEEWAPAVWVKALNDLDRTNLLQRGWSAWPPGEPDPDSYWFLLAHEVTKQVVDSGAPIFPSHDDQCLVSVHDNSVLFANPTDNRHPLFAILSCFGVHIVQPPPQIFSALEAVIHDFEASALSPRSLHNLLCDSLAQISGVLIDVKATHKVMEYLVLTSSPPTLELLSDLPWFSRMDGSLVSLSRSSTNTRWIVPSSEEEARLFMDDPCMLSWECVSDDLRIHLLKTQTTEILNVTAVNVELVSAFLYSRFSPLDGSSDELPEADVLHHVNWLFRFWTWVAQWPAREHFFQTQIWRVQHLHLLPTSHLTLRKMSSRVIIFQNVSQATVEAWGALGVHALHDSLPRDVVSILKEKAFALEQGIPGFVSVLIRSYNMDREPLLDQNSFTCIRDTLTLGLHLEAEPGFSPEDEQKLLRLPVFMVRHHPGERSILGSISGQRKLMNLPNHFPLPRLKSDNIVYIDVGDFVTKSLIKLVDRKQPVVLNELDILKLAIDQWDLQPIELQDRFIEKIFDNRHYTSALRERLKGVNFITVQGMDHRVPPRGLIDPKSPLADLYKGEAGKIPTGRFVSHHLHIMRHERFVDSSLNDSIVQERLEYFSSGASDKKPIVRKATSFVKLLDQSWKPSYRPLILRARSMKWFPYNDRSLAAPDQCRDNHQDLHAHPYYYDLHLKVGDKVLASTPMFRSALSWSDIVPSQILVEQLRLTLEPDADRKRDRLIKLLDYLGHLHFQGALTKEVVQDLKKTVDGQAWVPVVAHSIGSHNLATSKHAVLSESGLRPPFRQVNAQLKDFHLPFLLKMGCTERPAFETLVEELRECNPNSGELILEEIAHHHPDFDRTLVVVPDITGRMCPVDSVYYCDMSVIDFSGGTSQRAPIHDNISRRLAAALGIPFASSLTLGEDDDEDEQMSEDLVGRICGFLREYDPQYALNEFLANADDGGATEFAILLDSRNSHQMGKQNLRVIAPAFESIQGFPSLILYNNATLTDEDFKGLLHVGRGGKVGQSETHGRHGLGALSFYYFSDIVTVISRDTVLFLDPSSKYLPPRQHGQKRTALMRKFSDIALSYPDQFKSYPDLGFSPSSSNVNGAIFILPLVSSITERPFDAASTLDLIRGPYRDLSQNAFFFTKLEKISANRLSSSDVENLWCLSAMRSSISSPKNDLSQCILNLDGVKEDWLVATSNKTLIPALYNGTAGGLKLSPQSPMTVQLAIRVTPSDTKEPESYLFSTLRLPKTTCLPFHLHSRFAISSNRQSIVFDLADSRSPRDSKTSFNIWILEKLVPPLYLSALEHLLHSSSRSLSRRFDNKHWWLSGPADEVPSVVIEAFGKLLPEANNLLFKSADDQWISFRDAVFSGDETSRSRNTLLSLKAPRFVSSYRHSGLTKISSAKTVDTNFVKQFLLNAATLEILQTQYDEKKISAADIRGILEYVANDPPLVGLPLLILSTGELVAIPAANTSTVYESSNPTHADLFSSSSFLGQGYSTETIGCLHSDSSISVVALSSDTVTTLISSELRKFITDDERNAWLAVLWARYSSLPTPRSLEPLADASLKIVKTSTNNLSLRECLNNKVIYDTAAVKKEGLGSIIKTLGIDVLQLDSNSVIRQYISKRFLDKLVVNFLLCLQEKAITSFDPLTKTERDRLINWLQQNIHQSLSEWRRRKGLGIQKSFLLQLPLWEIYLDRRKQWLSASGVPVLPLNFSAESIIHYIKPTQSIAPYSSQLVAFLEYCQTLKQNKFRCMSAGDIMNAVSFPTKLENPTDFAQFKLFLSSLFQLTTAELRQAKIKLPVSDGTLRNVDEMYDHTVDLFEKTLKYTQPPSFLHEHFRDLPLNILRSLGMAHSVNIASFIFCASEIQRLSELPQPLDDSDWLDPQELIKMSDAAFRAYQEVLPRQLMMNKAQWARVDKISFIRPRDIRREGVSYDWHRYFDTPLPAVLAPSRFVRRKFEPIAWTQRYLCPNDPVDDLLALNATFGVPRVCEVVEHLKILTTKIAQHHPGDRALLSDIQATYKWLDDNSVEAREPLLSAGDLKLFLNVNDPVEDEWTGQWETAQNIVLNLHYDCEHLRTARDFLHKYDKLLLAAGCSTMKIFDRENREPAPILSESDDQRMRELQNEMRKSGELTDMIFIPTSSYSEVSMGAEDEYDDVSGIGHGECEYNDADGGLESDDDIVGDVVVDPLELRAHRLVLAAAIPYFRDRAKGWKVEGTVDGIRFYGSAFGAKLLLDYVYTGNFDFSSISTVTMDEINRLLRDFLELMQIADEWDMPKLKEKLEWNIIHKFDMIQRLPHANKMMLDEAEKYKATKLKEALVEFGKHNGMVLKILQKGEES